MSDILNLVNDAIFVSLVNTTLQITLLIPVIALIIWLFRIKSATTRYLLWLFALFAMLALPFLTPFIPQMDFTRFHHQKVADGGPDGTMRLGMGVGNVGELSEAGAPVLSTSAAKAAANREADVSLVNPVSVAYFIWCTGALSMLCITIGIYRKLRKLKIDSSDVESQSALEILSRLKSKLGIRRTVALKTSPEVYIPMSTGILSPVIIVPESVIDNSASDQLEMILTHELAHIKRCDYLTRLLQNMLKVVFFFHPLFHLMKRKLAKEREHICDDWVIDVTNRRSKYAECLVSFLERAVHKPVNIPVSMAMAERRRDIPKRIDMIVDRSRKLATKISRKSLTALLLIGLSYLPVIGGVQIVHYAAAKPASDGERIAFVRQDQQGQQGQGIWVMDADGENEKQLTFGELYGDPAWSPDGRQMAFCHRTEDIHWDIYIMSADGSDVEQITDTPEDDCHPTWSPDGRQITFDKAVWEEKPDGKWILKSAVICVMNVDGTDVREITESPPFSQFPVWSPDSGKIAFERNNQVWIMDVDGENQKMINDRGSMPAWSPDGKMIAFNSPVWGGSSFICVMDADGANVEILTAPGPSNEWHAGWSPDGMKIVFCGDNDGSWIEDIYIMEADGSNVQQLTNTPVDELWPDWAGFPYAVEPAGKLRSTWGKIKSEVLSGDSSSE